MYSTGLPGELVTKKNDETRTKWFEPESKCTGSDASQGINMDINTDHATDRDVDWSPENIVKILKQSGGFSTLCTG